MKWYRPRKLIETEIQEPIRGIAIVSLAAMAIAIVALFIALGKEYDASEFSHNTGSDYARLN